MTDNQLNKVYFLAKFVFLFVGNIQQNNYL